MEVMRLVGHINLATDEDFELLEVIAFINDGIAEVNTECGALFPFIDEDLPNEDLYNLEEYDALPDTWIRALLVPFAAGRIKENDSSQFEYRDWYGQFANALDKFKDKYEIPEMFLDANAKTGRYEEDYSQNVMSHLRGW